MPILIKREFCICLEKVKPIEMKVWMKMEDNSSAFFVEENIS